MEPPSAPPSRRALFWRWIPAVVWMGGILTASGEAMSHSGTSRFFRPFMERLIPGIREETFDQLHLIARKCGHVIEYAILAMLLWFAVGSRKAGWAKVRLVLGLSVVAAALDEWRQSFTPSRGAAIADVALDAVGAALGIAAVVLALRLFRRER